MRPLLIMGIAFACACVCCAQETERPFIPEGVKYKFIDDKRNAEVRAYVAARFLKGQSGVSELFEGECTCAPGFWRLVKGLGIKSPKLEVFTIPNERTGKVYNENGAQIQDPGDLNKMADYLATQVGVKPTVRRLTSKEIDRFWVVIPFEIEEPLFIVESNGKAFVLCLRQSKNDQKWRIWWVDALGEYNYGERPTHDGIKLEKPVPATNSVSGI